MLEKSEGFGRCERRRHKRSEAKRGEREGGREARGSLRSSLRVNFPQWRARNKGGKCTHHDVLRLLGKYLGFGRCTCDAPPTYIVVRRVLFGWHFWASCFDWTYALKLVMLQNMGF